MFYFLTVFPIISLMSKFGIKRLPSLCQKLFQKFKVSSGLNMTVFLIGVVNQDITSKIIFFRQPLS